MKFNKLVRDKIPGIIKNNGEFPKIHIADKAEYWKKLLEKLSEEVKEFKQAGSIEELADIQEVLDAIIEFKKFNKSKISSVKSDKAKRRGKFKKRIILDETK
jgi:predicted house-cleaning noncanonical NTP pyrophosphatase (MazG superfamily)